MNNDEILDDTAAETADIEGTTEAVGDWRSARVVGTEEEAALAAGFLDSNGIPAQVQSLHASEFPTDFGHLGEVHIMVPADRLAEAQGLLEQADTGEGDAALPVQGD
jgi:hypothetical protein